MAEISLIEHIEQILTDSDTINCLCGECSRRVECSGEKVYCLGFIKAALGGDREMRCVPTGEIYYSKEGESTDATI